MGKKEEGDYMNDDIEASVCQLIVMQKVEPAFFMNMQDRAARKNKAKMEENGDGVEIPAEPFLFEFGVGKDRSGIAF